MDLNSAIARLLFSFFLLSADWHVVAVTEFIQYPTDANAALGTNITLECVANQPILVWKVNNAQLLDQESFEKFRELELVLDLGETENDGENGSYRTTISIFASVYANNTIEAIVCQAGPNPFNLEDGPTLSFSVYGLPLAPAQLEVRGNTAFQLILSWAPPFTLPGEKVSYSLLIEDQTTGQSETVSPLTDTGYTHGLSEREALACHPFLFSIFSVNDVGHSLNSSSAPPTIHPSGPGLLGAVQSKVIHDDLTQTAEVNLFFQSPNSCFPLSYTVLVDNDLDNTEMIVSPPASIDNGVAAMEVAGLRKNSRYTATITAYNNFQFSIDNPVQAEPVSFVTSGLQSVSVFYYKNGTLRITCTFAEGTSSAGCRVSLMLNTVVSIDLFRSGNSLVVIEYDTLVEGVPSAVQAHDLGVTDPLVIVGTVFTEEDPTPSSTVTVVVPAQTNNITFPGVDSDSRDESGVSAPIIIAIIAAIALLVTLAVGMIVSVWCVAKYCRRPSSKSGHLQAANYEEPVTMGTHIPLSDNQAYGVFTSGLQAAPYEHPVTMGSAYEEPIAMKSSAGNNTNHTHGDEGLLQAAPYEHPVTMGNTVGTRAPM